MENLSEPLRLYLVKNLRGIIYFSDDVFPEAEFSWLKKKFRYRELGVSETIKVKHTWKKLLKLPKIEDDPVLDSVLQASRFICPLIILRESSLADFGKAVIVKLKTKDKLDDKDLKFNLRLINYSITDFYLKTIELALRSNLDERKRIAEEDLRRFWRIKSNPNGKTLIAYVEPLLLKSDVSDPTQMSIVPYLILDLVS